MKTLSKEESLKWCKDRNLIPAQSQRIELQSPNPKQRFKILDQISKSYHVAKTVEGLLFPRDNLLMFVSSWNIWKSSENMHLYYKLRQSYADYKTLEDWSGHLFADYERNDAVSFIQLGVLSGWDFFLLPEAGYGKVFVSHDGWCEFVMDNPENLSEASSALISIN